MLDHLINSRANLTQETSDSQSNHPLPITESKPAESVEPQNNLKALREKIDKLVDCE